MLPKTPSRQRCAPLVAAALPLLTLITLALPCRSDVKGSTSLPKLRTRGGIVYDPALPLDAVITPQKIDPAHPPKTFTTTAVSFTSANGEKVPGVFVAPIGAKAAPTVILLHGLGGKKEDVALLGIGLASNGYASLAIDAAGHGARPKIAGKAPTNLSLLELRSMVAQTVADLGHAVDFLATRPEVDAKRIGYLGISMGAIEGTLFVADEPRIKTAVFWAGGGDWGKLISTTSIAEVRAAHKTPEGQAVTPDAIEKVMADVDPVNAVPAIAPRPVLFINGDKDTVVPVPCADELIAAAGEPKTRLTLPGGHIPDPWTMAAKSLEFLGKNLK